MRHLLLLLFIAATSLNAFAGNGDSVAIVPQQISFVETYYYTITPSHQLPIRGNIAALSVCLLFMSVYITLKAIKAPAS